MNYVEMVKKTGLSRSTLHRTINGTTKPQPRTAEVLKLHYPELYKKLEETKWRKTDEKVQDAT